MSKLQSDFTTPEQSKRLLELGVPKWTANYYYEGYGFGAGYSKSIYVCPNQKFSSIIDFPCWSVGRLMEIFAICFDPDFIEFDIFADGTTFLQQMIDKFETCIDAMDFSKLEE